MKRKSTIIIAMFTLFLSVACAAEPKYCFSFENETLTGIAGKAADVAGQVRELVPAKSDFPNGKDFTVSCFVHLSTKPGYQILLSQAGINKTDRIWWIAYFPDSRCFDFLVRNADNNGQSQVFSQPVDPSAEWIHVAAVCRDDKLIIRATELNKPQLETISLPIKNLGVRRASIPLLLGGRRGEQAGGTFGGAIDELTLWGRALSDRELDVLFQLGKSGKIFSVKEFNTLLAQSKFKPAKSNLSVFDVFPQKRRLEKPGTIEAGKYYLFPEQLANGDFAVEFQLTMSDPTSCRWLFELGADGFRFDGTKIFIDDNTTIHRSIGGPSNRQIFHWTEKVPHQFTFGLARRGDDLTVLLDGKKVWKGVFIRDTVGELGLNIESGVVNVNTFSVRGALFKRDVVQVFSEGEAGSKSYRIPALTVGNNGLLHAFAEARFVNLNDTGKIDIAYCRSTDGGKNWEPVRFLTNKREQGFSSNNPAPAFDPISGNLHLFYLEIRPEKWGQYVYRVFHTISNDNGESWSDPVDIAPMLPKEWGVFHPGPGHALVLKHGKHAGRIIVPGWCYRPDKGKSFYQSTLIISDDGGRSFRAGAIVMEKSDECMIEELSDGALLMAIRPSYIHNPNYIRYFAVSKDGGENFESAFADSALSSVNCQNSFLIGNDGFLNYLYPAGGNYAPDTEFRRAALTLRRKLPNAKVWGNPLPIYLGPSGYSDLAELPDGSIGILFEGGRKSDTGAIRFVQIPKEEF